MLRLILKHHDQIIIYGAKGWVGRSAVEVLLDLADENQTSKVTLIGSKTEPWSLTSLPIEIFSAKDHRLKFGERILFLNSAYLRREKLQLMTPENYVIKNSEIMDFPKKLLKTNRITTFINLSSGVANKFDSKSLRSIKDPYARCKVTDERELSLLCEKTHTNLINCRIFSMTGRYINEFNNLAIASFISQAQHSSRSIEVNSPSTLRTYVDAKDLASVLFTLSQRESSYFFDSGGTLLSLGELADEVALNFPNVSVNKSLVPLKSEDYFGEFQKFNSLAYESGIKIQTIREQVQETIKAFK